MRKNWVYRRGDLYLANLGVPVGSKQGGVRPVVVLQNDVGNYYAPTITIAPLTFPTYVRYNNGNYPHGVYPLCGSAVLLLLRLHLISA